MELSKMGYKMATIIMENNIVMLNLLVRFWLCDNFKFGIAFHSQLLFSK